MHRDVKPENIMVRADGVVKVLDFGIARRVSSTTVSLADTLVGASVPPPPSREMSSSPPSSGEQLTAKGTIVGTPLYMAPEQMRPGATLDARADQFSWAVTAYELLTGALPWGNVAPRAITGALRGVAPDPMRARSPELPVELEDAIMRALAPSPADRFQSMEQLLSALTPILTPPTPGPEAAPAAPSRPRSVRLAIVVGVALLGASLVLATRRPPAPAAVPTPPSTEEGASKPPGPIAAAALAQGMRAWRDGSSLRAVAAMEKALEVEPQLCSASLRIALWEGLRRPLGQGSLDATTSHARFKTAELQRDGASAYDRALLEASEPRFRPIADPAESERRLAALAERFPKAREPHFWIGVARAELGKVEAASEAFERAITLEPEMAPPALAQKAWAERGDTMLAATSYARCLAKAKSAPDCLGGRAEHHGAAGRCEAMEADVRAWLVGDPDSTMGYEALAEVLASRGAPVASVREAMTAAEERMPSGDERKNMTAYHRLVLLALAGDFDGAIAQARAFEDALPSTAAIAWRFAVTHGVIGVAFEAGRNKVAGDAALRFLARAEAWTPATPSEAAMPVSAVALAHRAGVTSRQAFERDRARWLKRLDAMTTLTAEVRELRLVWMHAHAGSAVTAEDARDAVAALSRFPPLLDANDMAPVGASMVGWLLADAGDAERALPYLSRGVRGCFPLNGVTLVYRTRAKLADLLVKLGRSEEARPLYQSVVDRWGAATPTSVTAAHARAALAAIR